MTVPSNLSAIRTKFRRITAQTSPAQISDTEVDKYINTFYIYDLPMHLPLFNMKEVLTFYTQPNVDVYQFPRNSYAFIQPPVYCAGYQIFFSQSREQFYRTFPKFNFFQVAGSSNGTGGPYPFFLTQVPVLRSSINENLEVTSDVTIQFTDLSGNSITITDNALLVGTAGGNLVIKEATGVGFVGQQVGNLNYLTGAVTINLPIGLNALAGAPINAQYVPYVASRPLATLFFQDQFIMRPVPDAVYQVQVDAWKIPIAFPSTDIAGVTDPQLNEWWQFVAYGAADKFFADNGDMESLQRFRPLFQEQLKLINRRTIKQQTSQRSSTIYSDQIQFPYNNQYYRF